ncbi:unnamed protein product [Brassica oleracea]
MAMFLNRILKLHARRDNARFFSSLPEFPYLLLGGKKLRDSPEGQVGKHMFFDPTKEEKVYSSEKTVPQELNGQPLLGASQGWSLPCTLRICTSHGFHLQKSYHCLQ